MLVTVDLQASECASNRAIKLSSSAPWLDLDAIITRCGHVMRLVLNFIFIGPSSLPTTAHTPFLYSQGKTGRCFSLAI